MINKKFSLESAYGSGVKTVLNNFYFFLISILAGVLACGFYLSFVGIIYFSALRYHAESVLRMLHHIFYNATGPLHKAGSSIPDLVKSYLPIDISQYVSMRDVISFDIAAYDSTYVLVSLIPAALALKLFLDMLSIGWTKIALDLQTKKNVSIHYLYEFYYLVPRVFVVNLIVGVATILGMMLFLIPGIFLFQRLRFAKYFVIDKNLGIVKALQSSWALTEDSVLHLFGFSLISIIIDSIGQALILTLFFIFPLQNQVEANVYRQMVPGR